MESATFSMIDRGSYREDELLTLLLMMQVVSDATETVFCADDAASRLKQRQNFSINSFQLLYRLDDVSITATD